MTRKLLLFLNISLSTLSCVAMELKISGKVRLGVGQKQQLDFKKGMFSGLHKLSCQYPYKLYHVARALP